MVMVLYYAANITGREFVGINKPHPHIINGFLNGAARK
jgi:hypothetical protein